MEVGLQIVLEFSTLISAASCLCDSDVKNPDHGRLAVFLLPRFPINPKSTGGTPVTPKVKKALQTRKGRGLIPIKYCLEQAFLPEDGFICFKPKGYFTSPYSPDEEDGSVPAIEGKWYESEQIAQWLKLHSEKGGRIVLHRFEGDGYAWGWEFDGKGRLRELHLRSMGKWT